MTLHFNKRKQRLFALGLFILPFCLYWNAIDNEYAYGDSRFVPGVEQTNKPVSDTLESPANFTYNANGFGPMAALSFSFEKQLFSGLPTAQSQTEKKSNNRLTQANISHFINVFLYALTALALLYVLRQIFPEEKNRFLPCLIVFIFIILPIHTANVSAISGRASILLLLGVLGALSGFMGYAKNQRAWPLIFAFFCTLFALLSQKSAVVLIGLVPVLLYYVKTPKKKIIASLLGVLGLIILAFFIKTMLFPSADDQQLLYFENPLAPGGGFLDHLAMAFYSLFFYLKMMIWPEAFSVYYGLDKIPIADFSLPQVWLSMTVFVPLTVYGIIRWWKRDRLGLAILFWGITALGSINLLFPIDGLVADRFAYFQSMGFAMLVGILISMIFKLDVSEKKTVRIPEILIAILGMVFFGYTTKIINRNIQWENSTSLFKAESKHLKKSSEANAKVFTPIHAIVH